MKGSLSAAAIATAALLAAIGPASAQSQGPAKLIVGDVAAARLYVYAAPDFALEASFEGISVGAHAGIIALSDGRILVPDETMKQVVAIDTKGEAKIVGRAPMPIPLGTRYGWAAVDPGETFYLTTSDDHDEAVELLSIVDLSSYAARQVRVDGRGPADAEVSVTAGGDPAAVILHLVEAVETYPLADLAKARLGDILEGKLKPTSSIAIGRGGHGDSFSPATGKWTGSTSRGIEIATLKDGKLGAETVIPWEADGLSGGRNGRQRLTADGKHEFGPLNAPVPPEKWAEADVHIHWVDLEAESARRVPLARGIVGRGGVSASLAAYPNIGPDGDALILVDADPVSPNFRQVKARVALPKLANGPVAGERAAGREGRYAAITPDGGTAFVSHGGEGLVSIVDTESGAVTGEIRTPTPLRGGGYLLAVTPGAKLTDPTAR